MARGPLTDPEVEQYLRDGFVLVRGMFDQREIELRQAVGAKTKDILIQFLVEAVTLAVVGGVIGIALGLTASILISTSPSGTR